MSGHGQRSSRQESITMAATKVGHALARLLGIHLQYRDELNRTDEIRRGESVFSIHSTGEVFVEEEPRSIDWMIDVIPNRHDLVQYVRSLFPFLSWIGFYNLQWLVGDLVAGMFSPSRKAASGSTLT